jgi:hypothetical protein
LRAAALALTAATRTHIDALMKRQRAGRIDHDEAAKALASYAKTLKAAQELLEQEHSRRDDSDHHRSGFSGGPSGAPEHSGGPGPSGGARGIHELRDELARHLERIVAEEEARGSDGLLV